MLKPLLNLTCVAVLFVSVIFGLAAWLIPIHDQEAVFGWTVRIGACVLGPLSLVGLIWLLAKSDQLPDLLWKVPGRHFGRDGVVFAFDVVVRDGIGYLRIHYQNAYEKDADVAVLVRPSQDFLMHRNDIEPIEVDFVCGPAAYGMIDVPWAIPAAYQGTKQSFDVGASIAYLNGTGKLLRNRVGEPLSSTSIPGAGSLLARLLRVALTGRLPCSLGTPTRVQFCLPTALREFGENTPDIEQREEWVLPDGFVEGHTETA